MDAGEAVADLLSNSGDRLLRLAYQLCHDRSTAEDLVQQALEQLFRRWQRGGTIDHPEAYARRAVLNEHLCRRRLRSADEIVTDEPPDSPVADQTASVEDRDALWRRLGALSPQQRAVLVLRYYEDVSDRDIAQLLGCRETTVRSLAARGLQSLRASAEVTAPVWRLR